MVSGMAILQSPLATKTGFLNPIPMFFWLESVLSRGKYLKTKAQKALTSSSIWRRVNLITRRPDHLVSRPAHPGELIISAANPPSDRASFAAKYKDIEKNPEIHSKN